MRPSASTCALALATALTLSCTSERSPRSCGSPADCPAGADCVLGACVAGGLPTASIALRAGDLLYTHRALLFDGSASTDPNPGHGLVSYRWAVQRGQGAHCDPSPASGAEPTLSTVFTCEGDYQVTLTVVDDLGLTSTPAALAVSVLRSATPPAIVEVGPDLTLPHRCAGTPLTCTAVAEDGSDRFRLRAVASDVESGGALSYAWSVTPPAGVDPAQVSVGFDPDAHASAPAVRLASGGAALAGTWTFTVTVTDADGLTTPAAQRVTISNAPPTLVPARTALRTAHAYHGEGRLYVAADTVEAEVVDPEGDPLSAGLELEEDAPSGCAFQVSQLAVTGGRYAGAFALTAAPGQEGPFLATPRRLRAVVRDTAGASASALLPLEVLNRPPALAWAPGAPRGPAGGLLVPHTYRAPCGARPACFEAAGQSPLVATDPDGDPVVTAPLEASAPPSGLAVALSGQAFTLSADPSASRAFRMADGRSAVALAAAASDPWTSSGRVGFAVEIQNRPPRPLGAVAGSANVAWADGAYRAEADVAAFLDDDGDPLHAGTSLGDALCAGFEVRGTAAHVTCALVHPLVVGDPPDLSALVGTHAVQLAAADPWAEGAAVASHLTVRDDHPPVNGGGPLVADACFCNPVANACGERLWLTGSVASAVPLPVGDADGTPVYAELQATCGELPGQLAGLGPLAFRLDLGGCQQPPELAVRVTDGYAAVSGTYQLTAHCSRAGQVCGHGPPPPGTHCQ